MSASPRPSFNDAVAHTGLYDPVRGPKKGNQHDQPCGDFENCLALQRVFYCFCVHFAKLAQARFSADWGVGIPVKFWRFVPGPQQREGVRCWLGMRE